MKNSFASRQQMAAIKKSTGFNRPYDDTNDEHETLAPTCLLDAIEVIVERAADCGLSCGFYKSVDASLEYLSSRLEMTKNEALLLSVAVNMGTDFRITLANIAEYFACSRIKVLKLAKDIDSLVERRYLRRVKMRDRETTYTLHYEAVESIQNDKPYIRQPQSRLNAEQLFEEIHKLIRALKHRQIDFATFAEEAELLIASNNHLQFSKTFKALDLQDNNKLILIKACDMLVNQDDELIMFDDIDEMFDSESVISRLHKDILNGTNELIKKEVLGQYPNDSFRSRDIFQLTEKACTELLGEFGITKSFVETPAKNKNLTQPSDIFTKSLYYNPSEEQQISRLESLLQPDAFTNITQRLADSGMRKGFACLFYGAPGTGKTETVLQLARKTGRALMQVNISSIKDKYVGESEKNIKNLFDRYRRLVESEPIAPILFFNEADAIFNKRSENTERAVDKMENAIQNIILQEMETLDGILIATTNLTSNLDSAFERRFIYKVKFATPSLEAKQAIWQSMIPSLSEEDAATLASAYNFSGGQIENIARKQTVEYILTGEQPSVATIRKLCDAECLSNVSPRRAIGF
ncbi:MAG: AAA family ATPase [Rikenellaceae bacterium]|nr:AAA family ATPase [Rikenellaceae bacterium]